MFTIDSARTFLMTGGYFYYDSPDELQNMLRDCYDDDEQDEADEVKQTINMNDTWGWAVSWGEHIPDEDLPEVARLAHYYGWCGILYWVSQKFNMRSEFHDNNRFIDFVANEERIKKEVPDHNKRAYSKQSYVINELAPPPHPR